MWFKNLRLYRLTTPFSLSPEELHERLTEQAFRPCASLEFSSYGWVPPLGRYGTQLSHAANGRIMICARKEEKILPSSVVGELVTEKVVEIEEEQMRKVYRKERDAIRDELIHQLLPQAFTRSSLTYAYISPPDGWLVIDAATLKKAEDLTSLLRDSLGQLSAFPPLVREAPAAVITRWLAGEGMPRDVVIEDECELRDPGEDGGVVRCKRQDLSGDEIQTHLEAGKQAVKLAIGVGERLSCVLSEDLSVKRLRFTDVVQEKAEEVDADDEAARFDSDFALMTLELADFITRLMEFFGGEDQRAYPAASEAA